MSSEFLEGAAEATFRLHVHVTRVMRQYPEAIQLVGKVNDEAAANDSAAEKDGPGIMRLDSALLFRSEGQDAPLLIKAAAAHRNNNTKEKRTDALFSPRSLCSFAAVLLGKLKTFHKKIFPASESTFDKLLLAQVSWTKTSLLSVKVMFLITMSLFSQSLLESSETLAACAKGHFQRLVDVGSRLFLLRQKTVTIRPRTNRSLLMMTTTYCRGLKRLVAFKRARRECELPLATSPRKQIKKAAAERAPKR